MAYQLTKNASNDLREIWLYSYEKWGEKKADSYVLGLRDTFLSLSNNPSLGTVKYQIYSNVRSYRYKSHHIFYMTKDSTITIVAIYHEKMNAIRRINIRMQ